MNYHILTLFPEMVLDGLNTSIIGRAVDKGLISIEAINIRDYSKDKHRRVDDTPYGGGKGMLMSAPTVCDCHRAVLAGLKGSVHTVYMSPKGKLFDQKKAKELMKYDNLVIICGHYEGVDSRAIDLVADEEISIGNFVVTGGEIPACLVVDAVSRMCDGVLAGNECFENESLYYGLLECPQYTKPAEYMGLKVPDVLQNGNHAEIEKWRRKSALEETKKKRPDLL